MAAIKDSATTVTLTTRELKPPLHTIDWSVEDMHKDFIFKSPAEMQLESKGMPDHKQCMFILQFLGKEGVTRNLFPLQPSPSQQESWNLPSTP